MCNAMNDEFTPIGDSYACGEESLVMVFNEVGTKAYEDLVHAGFDFNDYVDFASGRGYEVSGYVCVKPRRAFDMGGRHFGENSVLVYGSDRVNNFFETSFRNPNKNLCSEMRCENALRELSGFDRAGFPDAMFDLMLRFEKRNGKAKDDFGIDIPVNRKIAIASTRSELDGVCAVGIMGLDMPFKAMSREANMCIGLLTPLMGCTKRIDVHRIPLNPFGGYPRGASVEHFELNGIIDDLPKVAA